MHITIELVNILVTYGGIQKLLRFTG